MALTPNEILYKEFDKKMRGYDPVQVDDYLDLIVSEFEELIATNHDLNDALVEMRERLAYFENLQESLNNSILVAQEAAERLKQNARKEAELIIYEAEQEANQIVSEANNTALNILTETEALRRSSQSFREELRSLVQEQLDIIDDTRYDYLFSQVDELHQKASESKEDVHDPTRVDTLVEDVQLDFEAADRLAEAYNKYDLSNDNVSETLIISREDLKQAQEQAENEPKGESVLGQTIRIDLPED